MKLVVIGRGLSSMGLLWNVAKLAQRPEKIYWIGHNGIKTQHKDAHYCSSHSTALVARQGIQEGISPLGDLLFKAYYDTLDFLKLYNPPGVTFLRRFHLDDGGNTLEKYEKRFGDLEELCFESINLGRGHEEEAISFNPEIFLSWFEGEIIKALPQIEVIEDFVTGIDNKTVVTLNHGDLNFDKLANCTGAFVADFPELIRECPQKSKKAVGHYLHWEEVEVLKEGFQGESFCLTWKGHNLIYRHDDKTIVWGGSTYNDAIEAPRYKDLEADLAELLQAYPQFNFTGKRSIRTGMRPKGPKRQPIFHLSQDKSQLILNGFYKNGWSLCHTLGAQGAVELVLGV